MKGFPELSWAMTFDDAKKLISDTGVKPVGFGDSKTELAWNAPFDEIQGAATVRFTEERTLNQMTVILYAMAKKEEIFDKLTGQLKELLGDPVVQKESDMLIHQWKSDSGHQVVLTKPSDPNQPIVNLTMVAPSK